MNSLSHQPSMKQYCLLLKCEVCSLMQAEPSETHGAVAELEFDAEELAPPSYDAFADLVQMAVREDPSLATAASSSGQSDLFTCTQ